MQLIWIFILGLMGLLALAVLLVPAARRLNFPYTVMLAATGCLLGLAETGLEKTPLFSPIEDFLAALKAFEITSDAVFFIFLPALVFEAALAINVRRLMDDLAPILFLAVIGFLISTTVIAYPVSFYSGMPLTLCLLLGAIISATDPVAVVAIFRETGAPRRLSILVEGESLFNDATAIVVFSILLAVLTKPGVSEINFMQGIQDFLLIFTGGVAIGFISGRLVCWIIGRIIDLPLVSITLTISLAYLTFIGAEHYAHVSGVMAVLTAALVMGSRGMTVISPETWESLHETWEQIGFWANSIIFILVGMAVPGMMYGFSNFEWFLLSILIITAFSARGFIIFLLIPLLSHFHICQKVSTAYKTVMFWGGLRGAVSLALALAVLENPHFDQEIRNFIGILVTGFVLFTLFINATTIRMLINYFNLDELLPADIAVRSRATAFSLNKIETRLNQVADQLHIEPPILEQTVRLYRERTKTAREDLNQLSGIQSSEWNNIGLAMLTALERKIYTRQFSEGFLSSLNYRLLMIQVENLADGLKLKGIRGYRQAVTRSLGFDWRFQFAVYLQRKLGIGAPLSQRLSERFQILMGTRVALDQVLKDGLSRVKIIVNDQTGMELESMVRSRYSETATALEALALQYPLYAKKLKKQYLENSALRQELSEYQKMLASALISDAVFNDLEIKTRQRFREINQAPKLDLGLQPEKLLTRLPLFDQLPQSAIHQLATLFRPALAFPGEKIIKQGTPGQTMYFISSGAMTVNRNGENFMLASGDFFGEIALFTERPRNADVIANVYCELLTLNRKDFTIFLKNHPDLCSVIEKVALKRLDMDTNLLEDIL